MIEAVFFDLYETLVTEFDPGWKKKTPLGERLGLGVERFREEWRARRRPRHTGAYRDYRAVLREICETMGETPDEDLIQTLYTERCNAKTAPLREIRRDILGLLEDLEEMKLRIGLITNSEPEEVSAWPRSDLAPFFDDAVFSHKVRYMKPDPDLIIDTCNKAVHAEKVEGATASKILDIGESALLYLDSLTG